MLLSVFIEWIIKVVSYSNMHGGQFLDLNCPSKFVLVTSQGQTMTEISFKPCIPHSHSMMSQGKMLTDSLNPKTAHHACKHSSLIY